MANVGDCSPCWKMVPRFVHVALERHQRHLALPVGGAAGVVALGQAVFAGDVVKGFARAVRHRVGIHFFLDAFVFGLGLQVQAAKARHVGVDVAARVAVPQRCVQGVGQAEIPAARQAGVAGEVAKLAAAVFIGGKGDGVAKDGHLQSLDAAAWGHGFALAQHQQAILARQALTDLDLVAREGGAGLPVLHTIGWQAVVVAAHAMGVVHIEHAGRAGGGLVKAV